MKQIWIGWILSGASSLMMLFAGGMKVAHAPGLEQGFAHLGLPVEMAFGLGALELACTAIYLIPRTAVLGAILLTAIMGGAIVVHLRVGDPFFTQPILGAMFWGGLYLRDARLRALLPLVTK